MMKLCIVSNLLFLETTLEIVHGTALNGIWKELLRLKRIPKFLHQTTPLAQNPSFPGRIFAPNGRTPNQGFGVCSKIEGAPQFRAFHRPRAVARSFLAARPQQRVSPLTAASCSILV
jgi:hypothetical protein